MSPTQNSQQTMLRGCSHCFHRSVIVCAFLFSGTLQIAHAQFSDDFSDGDFTNPMWVGSTADFTVNASQQLQLNNTIASTSYLSAAFSAPSIDKFEWQFFVKQSFSPSGSNYGRVYLVSDQGDLTQSLNGYYLQFGEAGSNDAIELFRQTGLSRISVCRASAAAIASSFVVRVKVLRSNTATWEIYVDYTGGTNFALDATGSDSTFTSSAFLGVVCSYTVSNAKKFYYDDFYMGPKMVEKIPPTIQSLDVISSSELDLLFSESVDSVSAETLSNYSVVGLGNPSSAKLQADQKTVRLSFSQDFQNGTSYVLSTSGVKDLADNVIVPTDNDFLFFQSTPENFKDVIITEIFADPTPQVGLPDVEFVEIFNRSNNPVDLENWKFTDGSSLGNLSSYIFFPGEYLILTSISSTSGFTFFGKVLGVTNFPTLNNTGDALVLRNSEEMTIDSVQYADTWYKDTDKQEGGWSLELIDPANTCGEDDNWIASEDAAGGTPGKQNSVFANKPDLTGPKLLSAMPVSSNAIKLNFDEKLEKTLPTANSFVINPPIEITSVSFADASLTSLNLSLNADLQNEVLYTISAQNVYDCPANIIQPEFSQGEFALPEQADSLDIEINEILFNPRPTGVDFVEVYNHSTKFINLKNWSVANFENDTVVNSRVITTTDFILKPSAYLVFTESTDIVKGEYPNAHEENFLEVSDLPSFNDDEGSVALIDDYGNVIDYFQYSKGMHSVLIKDEEGVSLERIAVNQPTNEIQNWKSASSVAGFATPGYINSNAQPETSLPDESIRVDPEIFIPEVGQPNFAKINFNFEQSGYIADVKILDAQGREIKQIANNETLGMEGFFRWDGDRDDGSKARVGYYVVWFEVFDVKGTLKTFRKRVVIATKF